MNEQLQLLLSLLREDKVSVLDKYLDQGIVIFQVSKVGKSTVYCIATNKNVAEIQYTKEETTHPHNCMIVRNLSDSPMFWLSSEMKEGLFNSYVLKKIDELK